MKNILFILKKEQMEVIDLVKWALISRQAFLSVDES